MFYSNILLGRLGTINALISSLLSSFVSLMHAENLS